MNSETKTSFSISNIGKPVKIPKKNSWTKRFVTGLTVGPFFCFSMIYAPYLFHVAGMLVILGCLLEFKGLISAVVEKEFEHEKVLHYIYVGFGLFMPLILVIFDDLEIYGLLLILDFIILVFANIFAMYFSKNQEFDKLRLQFFLLQFVGTFYSSFSLGLALCIVNRNPKIAFLTETVVIGTDCCAMFIGRSIGKRHLFVPLSPKKTWEGFWGAIFVGGSLPFLLLHFFFEPFITTSFVSKMSVPAYLVYSFLCSFFAQLGDLTQSFLKRFGKIKDSGTFFPGHGGALDRVCGLIFAGAFAVAAIHIPWFNVDNL